VPEMTAVSKPNSRPPSAAITVLVTMVPLKRGAGEWSGWGLTGGPP
jgi:hypothetical protein